jgi:nicotinamide phosphoribosyltransferase
MTRNLILEADSYKLSHPAMIPADTDGEFHYIEARTGASSDPYPDVLWFGLQAILHGLSGRQVTEADIRRAEVFQAEHMPGTHFNRHGWETVVHRHDGRLPVTIKAVPEGSVVPRGHVLMTVESEACPWLPGHLEDILLRVWYPTTVATRGLQLMRKLREVAVRTGSPVEGVAYQVHDFGDRGVSCREQAGIGGGAHLTVFRGSDTINGQRWLSEHYGAPFVSAGSVAASQHSIMTSNGKGGEHALIDRLITMHPNQILSIVADSYDYKAFVDAVIDRHEIAVKNRTRVVIRPDSTYDDLTPAGIVAWTLNRQKTRLEAHCTRTPTGHIVVPFPVLWGDGIDDTGMLNIASVAAHDGFASQNLVFGSGGWLLQKCNRDTLRFAMKLSARKVDGEWVDVQKNPLDRSKASKGGRLALVKTSLGLLTMREENILVGQNLLEPVFKDGLVLRQQSLTDIRSRIAATIAAQPGTEVPAATVTAS